MNDIKGQQICMPQGNFFFAQHDSSEWMYIDSVAIGKESFFSYKTIKNDKDNEIGVFLDCCYSDANVVAVVYDWKKKLGYCKKGFDLNSAFDYKYQNACTSFVVVSRISSNSLISNTPYPPFPPPDIPRTFITVHEGNFVTETGERFHCVGPNIYWLGLTENYHYPTHKDIENMFLVAKNMSSTVIRSHTIGFSSGHTATLLENLENPLAWEPIDFTFYMAYKYNIRLICPLTDNYWWNNGNYGDYCAKYHLPKSDFWTNMLVRNEFKTYISAWLNHINRYTGEPIKNDPHLFLIELGNELGNIRPGKDGLPTTRPPREWLEDISLFIKSIDANHLILSGTDECLGGNTSQDFSIDSIDVFSSHFYHVKYERLHKNSHAAAEICKPYIIGEYSGHFDDDWFSTIEQSNEIKGSVFWGLYPLGTAHTDGQTYNYGDPACADILLKLTNHHRRMCGLEEIRVLPDNI